MDYSSELLEAARNAYESEYAEWHNRQEFRPVDVKLFKYLLERVTDETEGWAFEDYDRLLRVVNAKYQGIKPDLRGLEPGARSGDYGDYSDEPFDSSENDFPGYDYMSKEPSDEVVEETVRATAKADRREALQAINEILEKYYPHKTIFAATDFDKIRERFAARAPRLGRDISDLDLKSLIFSVGATLIGKLKPREERLGASRSVSEPYRQGPFGESKLERLDSGAWSPQGDSYDIPSDVPGGWPSYDRDADDISRTFGSSPSFGDEDPDVFYSATHDFQGSYGYSRVDEQNDWEERQGEIERENEMKRQRELEDPQPFYEIPYQTEPCPPGQNYYSEEIGSVDDNYDRSPRRGVFRGPNRPIPSVVGSTGSLDAQRRASMLRELEAETKASDDDDNVPFAEAVKAAREILQKYFPFRRVRMNRGLLKFRHFLEMRFADFDYDNKKLYMVLKYAGGVYIGGYASILEEGSGSTGKSPAFRRPSPEAVALPKPVLQGTQEIVDKYFPKNVAYAPDDLELFSKLFHERFQDVKLPESALTLLLENVGVEVREQESAPSDDSTLFEAYVAVAKLVLREHFSKAVFHEDLSDFKRFRIVFEGEAGPNAVLSDEKLVEVFRAAGGVFVPGSANDVESAKPTETLSRAEVIKRIVSEKFVGGLNPKSRDDMDSFRKIAKNDFGMDFFGEPDPKLTKILSRCLVSYDGKLHYTTEKTKETIKQRVASLFETVGASVIYYESFFKLNEDWLKKAGIDSEGLLQAFLEKYYSSYSFNEYYFEQKKSLLSERVKVENEIERVWGASESLSADDLSKRVCVPVDRIEKAMDLDVDKFERRANGEYRRRKKIGSSRVPEKLDDLFDATFGLLDDPSLIADLSTPADKAEKAKVTIDVPKADVKAVEDNSEENENSKESSSSEEPISGAKAFVKSKIDAWLEEGGKLAYYQAFFDRWSDELREYGVADTRALADLLAESYPDFCRRGDYFEPERDDEDLVVKIKREMDRVWSEDTPARRVVDLIKSLYVTKEAFEEIIEEEENLETLGVDKRSNGYLVRKPKKLEGKRPRRLLKIKSKSSGKNSAKVVRKPSKVSK